MAATAVVDVLALVGDFAGGSRETDLGDGRVALDFWTDDPQAEAELERLAGNEGIDLDLSSIAADPGWKTAMREFHRPVTIGGRLRMRPPWEPAAGRVPEVIIDPGLAFGTGQHATTRMCIELLLGRPRGGLVDAGCGSGILALVGARLGHDPVWAFDHDPDSVEATRANAEANGLRPEVDQADLHLDTLPVADGIVANLTLSLMPPLARAMDQPPRWLILSGLRPFETGDAAAIFAPAGLAVEQRRSEDGWSALLLVGRNP